MRITSSHFYTLLPLVFISLILNACSLLAPKVQTELTELRAGDYELDPKHTAVLFKVEHLGLSKFIGRFEKVEASLDFDAEHIENSSLQALVDMASINVNNERFARTLRGADWLNVERFPQAVFVSKTAERVQDNRVVFSGDLTFLGVTKDITAEVIFNGGANNMLNGRYTIGFEAHTRFKRSDFGLDKYLALVGDEIEIEVHAEFVRIR